MEISSRGIELQTAWEGFRATKYPDGNGYSIGYGTHIDTAAEQYLLNATITKEQGKTLLLNDNRNQFIPAIRKYIKVPLTQNQLDGLLDLVYNVGPGCLYTSGTTTGLCNAINSRNQALIEQKFKAYNKVRVKGVLTTSKYQTQRRNADLQMFLYGKIVLPNGTDINPTTQEGTEIVATDSFTTLNYVIGGVLLLVGSIAAYKQGVFKNFSIRKFFKRER